MWETFLIKLLVGLLQYFQAREDLKARVRAEISLAGMESANHALGFKLKSIVSPDGGSTLRVSNPKAHITLPSGSPGPNGGGINPPL